ncbi:acyl-CoA dehydrogenase family protein [Rhodanobacter sp. L36]|uniref:acyl-CoA dehydrogenase family protein n=1 Tax=Rhodanobacter sp. L36 TaxID=1747221 RepID=UPI00131C4E82|nr:acyl-CoA dehydrogenase family protein [Rhodanobacter sp. L36]
MNVAPAHARRSVNEPLIDSLARVTNDLAKAAREDDQSESFPTKAISLLQQAGCTKAVLPKVWGGRCLGWRPTSRATLLDVLQAIGGVHLSVARLFEGHVNAFQLLWTFGTSAQRDALCAHVHGGGLLGVWNAPSPRGEMSLTGHPPAAFRLQGSKAYASGAGHIERPLVTAKHEQLGTVMVWPLDSYVTGPASEWSMQGMRASTTRSVTFNSAITSDQVFGAADDYHRQPIFSGGAWRFLAAQLGAGRALLDVMRLTLVQRGRADDAHQRARMAEGAAAIETARLWVEVASSASFDDALEAAEVIAKVDMARMVVERQLLDVLEIVQRSVGLSAFSRASELERIARDLATYLRQPAPDGLRDAIGRRAFDAPIHPTPGLHDDLKR